MVVGESPPHSPKTNTIGNVATFERRNTNITGELIDIKPQCNKRLIVCNPRKYEAKILSSVNYTLKHLYKYVTHFVSCNSIITIH